MPSTSFLTTCDGDVILRAGQEPSSTHDFRVHKFILSLASPVFKDMFTLPQPPDHNRNKKPDIPIVGISESPEVFDVILRFIYPGVEPPKVDDVSTLAALFSAADKYNIASIYPVLKESLKTFLPSDSFRVYIIACQFGLPQEAKEAARVSTPRSVVKQGYDEAVQHISGPDVYRFVRFVQEREDEGLRKIEDILGWPNVGGNASCDHWDNGQHFYLRLAKEVEDVFVRNPCLELKDLFEVFGKIPDPPLGCKPQPNSAQWYYGMDVEGVFGCPLLPMSIRHHLIEVFIELESHNRTLLHRAFEEGVGSG